MMNFSRMLYLCLLLACSFAQPALSASIDYITNPDHYKSERILYKQAMNALENKNFGQYEEIRTRLNNYPLTSYLDYEFLRRHLGTKPELQVKNFLEKYKGYPVAKLLHIEWLGYLARNNEWRLYNQYYSADLGSEVLECYKLQADLVLNTNDQYIYEKISEFWLKPYSVNSACNRAFSEWEKHGYKTQKLVWQRYQRALLTNNVGLTQYLSTQLNKKNQKTAKLLRNAGSNIDYWVNTLSNKHGSLHLESATVKHLLKTITNIDHEKGAHILEKQKVQMEKNDLMEAQRLVAWYFAKTSGERAVRWIKQHTDHHDPAFAESLLRFSLHDMNWALYRDTFRSLPAVLKNQEEWLYWYVIAQEKLGFEDNDPALKPKALLEKLSLEQSFYGLLAARKNKSPIFPNTSFQPQPANVSDDVLKRLGATIELYHMGDMIRSNNDWAYTTSRFNTDEWRQAGIIAYRMGWNNRTIQAFGQARIWTAAAERFPILYQEDFYSNAKRQGIDPGWILAVARQESAFSATAKSPVGATGVLQIMPATAQKVARKMGMSYSPQKLLTPSYNITLGTKYLKDQLDTYDNNYILATAAYNAGPGRVKEWLGLRPITDDWAHWVATIPYKETRGYVQNIMTYSQIYNMKLDYLMKGKK